MNTKIALSLLSIVTALSLMGGATYAFFSDSGTSSGNIFSTGSLDLLLADGNESATDNVTASFGGTLAPGTCTGAQTLNLQNSGTIAANHAEVKVVNTVTDTGNNASPDIDQFLRINSLSYDGNPVTITSSNTTAFADLDDWETLNSGDGLDNLALTDLGGSGHDLVLDVCLDSSAGDTLQSDSVSALFTVTLNQEVSQ